MSSGINEAKRYSIERRENPVDEKFTIKPLEWERQFQDWTQNFSASTPFGSYAVRRTREDCDPEKPWEGWLWEYCFQEYYDEGAAECRTADEGKAAAQADWLKRLSGALEKVI